MRFGIIIIITAIVIQPIICQESSKPTKKSQESLDRSKNEIKENVSIPEDTKNVAATTSELNNEITTEMKYLKTDEPTRPTKVKESTTTAAPLPKPTPTTGKIKSNMDAISPMDKYLLEGLLDIVDEKFNTLNKRLMTLERGMNNLQYYNVRSFRVVNTHFHAIDTILHTMHTQMGQSEQQNKAFEQSITSMKNEVVDLQALNNGMFQAIEQNLVHFHQDLEQKFESVAERIDVSNAHILQLKNESAYIRSTVEQLEITQKDMQETSDTSMQLTSEILHKSDLCVNTTADIKTIAENIEENSVDINNTVAKLTESVAILSSDTYEIKQGLETALMNITIAKVDKDELSSDMKDNLDKTNYQEFRAKNSHVQMSCGKMLEILDEKFKHINVTISEGQASERRCDSNIYPPDFKSQSKKLLRALSTVNENVFQSVTLYKHTGNLIERVISDTEYIASEQIRLREDLVAYLLNGTFDLFNKSIPDFAEFIASPEKTNEDNKNESHMCTVTKSLVDEILKMSFNGTQLVQMLTDLTTSSTSSIQLSIDKLDHEINRLNKIKEEPLLSAPFYQKSDAFIRDDPKAGANAQIKDIQNKTDWIYQLSEAIASNTGWIPYVFHSLRFVENQVNKTLKFAANIDAKSEELLLRNRANMAIMFKPKQKPPSQNQEVKSPLTAPDGPESPEKQTGSECSVNSNQSAIYEHMMSYVYNTNVKLNRLIPALTDLLGEPRTYLLF